MDFSGQSIYVGLDVHKKSWAVSIFSEQCAHKKFTQPPEADKLAQYLKRNFPGAAYQAVYEAGFRGFWAHDRLQEQGVNCIVVHPADVPTTNKERTSKRDRTDCRKLARSLRNGELKGIYVPTRLQGNDELVHKLYNMPSCFEDALLQRARGNLIEKCRYRHL